MIKHAVTYMDFNGRERTEDFYFHLSLPEVARIEAEIKRPLDEHFKQLAAEENVSEMMAFIEKIILGAYGRKTPDGRSFQKSKELKEEFENSQAYAELFEQLLTNPDLARKFGEGMADTGKAKKNQVAPKVVTD